jgi:hypothetical protein
MNVSAPSISLSSFHPRLILLAVLCLTSGTAPAQASTDYTNDLPSVERVKAEIKGSDPTDSLARQVAVFTYLYTYVDRIKLNRDYRGPYTPGETRVMTAYRLAAYQTSQDYAKTHTPAEAAAFERLHGQYEMNSDFYKDWSRRLIGPQSAAAYKGAEAGLAATQKAHVDSINRANEEAKRQSQAQTTNGQGLSNDPTAVATRRCLELGGSNIACMGKGLGAGFMGLIGLGSMDELTGPGAAGVVLSGLYKNAAGANLSFDDSFASATDCGKALPVGYPYTIEKQPGSLRVLVRSEPKPYTVTMRPDGGLNGPGPIDITGKIIIGYHTVTTTQMIDGQRAMFDQCNGPCQTTSTVPDYGPKTERCSIGSLTAPPKPPPSSQQSAGADSGLLGMVTEIFNTGEMNMASEPGLRMIGKYASGNLLLYFTSTSVILDCGQAHVRDTYSVENASDHLIVHIANSGSPINLSVEPDNSLHGSGSTTVSGRLVNGMNGDNITYTPHAETCAVGTFRPATGSPATTSTTPSPAIASNSPTPVAPATGASPAPRAAAPASAPAPTSTPAPATSSGTRASMRVIITSQFPSGPNPLAGQKVFVMRERMDDVLRKLNLPVPPNTSPGKAMQLFATACQSTDCKPLFQEMAVYYVTATDLDATGKATLNATAATGTYFFYSVVRTPQGSLIWDIPVNLAAGDNTITLTRANAELIQ